MTTTINLLDCSEN